MRPTTLRDRGLLAVPFDAAVPTVRAAWRRVLIDTLGGVDDGAALYVIGSADERHVFTLTISPGADTAAADSLCLPLAFRLTTKERLIAEGDCRLSFVPSAGARRTTTGELRGTIRWSTSRVARYRSLGRRCTSINEVVGNRYQDYLSALGRTSIEHR